MYVSLTQGGARGTHRTSPAVTRVLRSLTFVPATEATQLPAFPQNILRPWRPSIVPKRTRLPRVRFALLENRGFARSARLRVWSFGSETEERTLGTLGTLGGGEREVDDPRFRFPRFPARVLTTSSLPSPPLSQSSASPSSRPGTTSAPTSSRRCCAAWPSSPRSPTTT